MYRHLMVLLGIGLVGCTSYVRADVVTGTDHHEIYQRNAPQVAAGLYLVPKVIE